MGTKPKKEPKKEPKKPKPETEGQKAKRLRLERGETQIEFARYFGVTNSMVTKWERGVIPVPWYVFFRLPKLPLLKKKFVTGQEFQRQRGMELRRKISVVIRQNPTWTNIQLAEYFEVSDMTISRHRRVISASMDTIAKHFG